jgi:AcrR family transcriptional regulator
MPANPSTRAATTGLTYETVVDAAAELVQSEGFEALSMRNLARKLGVGAMTLYGYVRTKEELLGALADRVFGEMELPDASGLPWRERITEVYRAVRRVFLAHPELLPIVATQRIDGIAAYRGAELVLGALREAGLEDRRAVSVFSVLTSFTIGAAMRESGLGQRGVDSLPGLKQLPPGEFANVIGLAGLMMTRDAEQEFEAGLELLISGIETTAAQ